MSLSSDLPIAFILWVSSHFHITLPHHPSILWNSFSDTETFHSLQKEFVDNIIVNVVKKKSVSKLSNQNSPPLEVIEPIKKPRVVEDQPEVEVKTRASRKPKEPKHITESTKKPRKTKTVQPQVDTVPLPESQPESQPEPQPESPVEEPPQPEVKTKKPRAPKKAKEPEPQPEPEVKTKKPRAPRKTKKPTEEIVEVIVPNEEDFE